MKVATSIIYKAKLSNGAFIHVVSRSIPLEVHQMIVWALNNPDLAEGLLPRYRRLRNGWAALPAQDCVLSNDDKHAGEVIG